MSLSSAIICIKKDEFSDDELDILENEFSSGNIDLNKDTDELNLILDQNCPKHEKLKRNISITDQLDILLKTKVKMKIISKTSILKRLNLHKLKNHSFQMLKIV